MTSIRRTIMVNEPDPSWTGADLVEIGQHLLGQPVQQIVIRDKRTDTIQFWEITPDGIQGPSGERIQPKFPANLRSHHQVNFIGFGFAKFTKLPTFGIWLVEEEPTHLSVT